MRSYWRHKRREGFFLTSLENEKRTAYNFPRVRNYIAEGSDYYATVQRS